jgi:hypothetical protein
MLAKSQHEGAGTLVPNLLLHVQQKVGGMGQVVGRPGAPQAFNSWLMIRFHSPLSTS